MSQIFQTEAPKYWERGLPVIPLVNGQKRPAIQGWQTLADRFPTPEEIQTWLANFPNGNIGLPLGAAAGLIAVDIDTEDPQIRAIIDAHLPPSPWRRVGKKGEVRIYRYTAERTTRIKDADNHTLVEILSKGSQIVLPPSTHPDTGLPYTANIALHDLDPATIPALPPQFDRELREAFHDAGIETSSGAGTGGFTRFVPAGARDSTMVWMAGLFARDVLNGKRTLLDVLGEIGAWVENFTEKVVGDDVSKPKAWAKVAEFLRKDVTTDRNASLPIGWDDGLTDAMKAELGLDFDDDDVSWSPQQIRAALVEDLSLDPEPGSENFSRAVDKALSRVVRNGKIDVIETNKILRLIQKESRNQLTITVLNRRLKEMRQGEIEGVNQTEIAEMLHAFLSRYGEVRFDQGHFWQWKGAWWGQIDNSQIERIVALEFGHYPTTKKHNDHIQVRKLFGKINEKPLKSYSAPAGINFANGFLTEDLRLVDHAPDHGMNYCLPFRYMPELAGHMPMFSQFLHDAWGQDPDFTDKVAALQEAMGVTLFGKGTRYQRAILLYGRAGSGKSRLPALLLSLLPPETSCSLAPNRWADRFLPAQLTGRLFNFAGELSEKHKIPGDIFKQVITGESMMVQHKNQMPYQMTPKATHWFCSNFFPRSDDVSAGFARRWLMLEFNHKVPAHKIIRDLEQRIVEHEAEAIVAWAVQGYVRVRAQEDYTLPSSHMACIDMMNMGNSTLLYYLTNCVQVTVGRDYTEAVTDAETLWRDYTNFCIGLGIRHRLEMPAFMSQMKELGHELGFDLVKLEDKTWLRHVDLKQ